MLVAAALKSWEGKRVLPKERFWPKVAIGEPDECWNWKRPVKTYYPLFSYKRAPITAYKAAFLFTYGDVPKGLCIRHTCDNPMCCNPNHLVVGTQRDNIHDAIIRGRFIFPKTKRGSEHVFSKLTEEQAETIRQEYHKTPRGKRGAFAASFGICRAHARQIAMGEARVHAR
jgi:hypothetical protein